MHVILFSRVGSLIVREKSRMESPPTQSSKAISSDGSSQAPSAQTHTHTPQLARGITGVQTPIYSRSGFQSGTTNRRREEEEEERRRNIKCTHSRQVENTRLWPISSPPPKPSLALMPARGPVTEEESRQARDDTVPIRKIISHLSSTVTTGGSTEHALQRQ